MPRPKCNRQICGVPDKNYFKPRGIPTIDLEEVVLSLDEFEAVRLADYEQLYQEEAAARMNISRQTFGRIIEAAHQKIADVLLHAKALKIEGGKVTLNETAAGSRPKFCRGKKKP
ncbi:MAG: DUF134 domain-containing protein [Deltaproteobacteria bacterium]|nr:DUF134 domain-containing protein [Deltaproteobacteria bacterium]